MLHSVEHCTVMHTMTARLAALWRLARQAVAAWSDDYAPSMGAALAYYTLFSIAPLLLIVISVAGLVFGAEAARGEIMGQLRDLMGAEGARAIQDMLEAADKPGQGTVATIVGAIFLLVGATSVFAELQTALDRIWRTPAPRSEGVWALLRKRLLSFGLIMGIGFLLMVSLVASAALAALGKWWGPLFLGWEMLAHALDVVLGFALTTAAFALIYKIMPRVRIHWRDVWIGAGVTAGLFTVGRLLIGLYIGRSGVTSVFGAAASLAVLLVWVYWSAQIFLLGAEFTWVFAHTHGSMRDQPMTDASPLPSRATTPAGSRSMQPR